MDRSVDIVHMISNMLDTEKYKEALKLPNDEKFTNSFIDNCSDLISVIIGKIEDNTTVLKPSLYSTCEELLFLVVQKATPEEALLEFIEQVELAKNDAQFTVILVPLQQILKKLSHKRTRSLEWSLNSISTYIETIPIPDYQLEGKERILLDSDDNIRRISRVCNVLIPFYRPFIEELQSKDNNSIESKQIITVFLISLQGKPFIYLDLDPDSNLTGACRQCCNSILEDICILEKDIFKLLIYVENCSKKKTGSQNYGDHENEKSPYEHEEKINMTTLSGFYYCILSGHFEIPDIAIPQVYSTEYVVHAGLLCVVHLLSFSEYSPLVKGITLGQSLLSRFSNNISHTLLYLPVHFDLCKSLMNVAIYCSHHSLRKDALNLISKYIYKFDYKGRSLIVKYILETANHSGIIGYAVTLYKNSVDEAFKSSPLPDCFTGPQFISIIKKICYLPFGIESDLVELADQIIASLNFLRYLAIKDTENKTGIRDNFSIFESGYLDQLRTALKMSKAHYEVKLKEIEEGKTLDNTNISVNVGGSELGNIPKEKKKEILLSALNVFHLMEGLVARVSECINMNQM